jgi:hypothetical protein
MNVERDMDSFYRRMRIGMIGSIVLCSYSDWEGISQNTTLIKPRNIKPVTIHQHTTRTEYHPPDKHNQILINTSHLNHPLR